MKATIKLLQHKLAKFVKYQNADVKRGVDMAKAKQKIQLFHILTQRLGSFHGYELFQDDEVVQAYTGAYGHEPSAIFIGDKIVVNTAFESIPTDYQEAIFFHELAHIQKNHRPNPFLYPIQARIGFGSGLQMEYEADEFSAMKGAKMLQALQYLSDQQAGTQSRAVKLRLKRLRSLSNV